MAITVVELPKSRPTWRGQTETHDRHYHVKGTADHVAAADALYDAAPATDDGLVRLDWGVEPVVETIDSDSPADCHWLGTVRYGVPEGGGHLEVLDVGDVVVSVSTRGGSEHVTAPLAQTGFGPAGDTAPEAHGINDDGRGHVEGVERYAGGGEVEVTKVYESAALAPDPDELWALSHPPHVNSGAYGFTDAKTGRSWSFAAGELLYIGHSEGRGRIDGAFEIRFYFLAAPNRSTWTQANIEITGGKQGHEYLWFRHAEHEDDAAHRLYGKAVGAYVAQLYPEDSLAALDL